MSKIQVKVTTYDDDDNPTEWEATAYSGQAHGFVSRFADSPPDEPELYDFMKNGEIVDEVPENVIEELWIKADEQ